MGALLLPAFTAALCVFICAERLINAAILAVLYVFRLSGVRNEKGFASMTLLQQGTSSALNILGTLVSSAVQLVGALTQYALTLVLLLLAMGMLVLAFEFSGHMLLAFSDAWNPWIGPAVQILVVWPVRLLSILFDSISPLWNAAMWIWKKVPMRILMQVATADLGIFLSMGEAILATARASAVSLVAWFGSFVCCDAPDAYGFCNPQCLVASTRVLDLVTPLDSFRQVVLYFAVWLKGMCESLSAPIDFIVYPFMDINLIEGVHSLFNAALFALTHLPALTAQRCAQLAQVSPVMCVPDFQPVFALAIAGTRSIGSVLDNWLDVTLLIVEAGLGAPTPQCTGLFDVMTDVPLQTSLFGDNATVIAGMTETMFARTDGTSVQYFSAARDWQTVLHPDAFPFAADVSMGVAAVAHITDLHHAPDGDDTMALLGCACQDLNPGIALQCGVALFDDQADAASRTIPVAFQLPSTGLYLLSCSKLKLKLQSLRWPATRTTSLTTGAASASVPPSFTCISKSTCIQARIPQPPPFPAPP